MNVVLLPITERYCYRRIFLKVHPASSLGLKGRKGNGMIVGLVCERLKRIFGLIILHDGNCSDVDEGFLHLVCLSDSGGFDMALVCLMVVAATKPIDGY